MIPPEAPAKPRGLLPSVYEEDRFFVRPVSVHGYPLLLYTDTAGGSFLFSDAVHQQFLQTFDVREEGLDRQATHLPRFVKEAAIPAPLGTDWVYVVQTYQRASLTPGWSAFKGWGGMLGTRWFAGRMWELDYPRRTLSVLEGVVEPPGESFEIGPCSETSLPRLRVEIAGEPLDLLLDTGAMTELTAEAREALGDHRAPLRAASTVVESVFKRWRNRHPGWRMLKAGEVGTGEPMIEVPSVGIAGVRTGPVWFSRRPEQRYVEWMSQWCDRTVYGSLGGNALRKLKLTLDYPRNVATVEAV
jgi:hypothetical protein